MVPGVETIVPGGTADSIPKEVPGGTVESMPKPDPGAVPGIGRIVGEDGSSCAVGDVGDGVEGCRHEYGTSGGGGFLEAGAGMGRGVLTLPGLACMGWPTGRLLPPGLWAKASLPMGENRPVG
jgi:hypothetical protein